MDNGVFGDLDTNRGRLWHQVPAFGGKSAFGVEVVFRDNLRDNQSGVVGITALGDFAYFADFTRV